MTTPVPRPVEYYTGGRNRTGTDNWAFLFFIDFHSVLVRGSAKYLNSSRYPCFTVALSTNIFFFRSVEGHLQQSFAVYSTQESNLFPPFLTSVLLTEPLTLKPHFNQSFYFQWVDKKVIAVSLPGHTVSDFSRQG